MSITHEAAIRSFLEHIDGQLDEQRSARMRDHLEACEACRSILDVYTRLTEEASEHRPSVALSEDRVQELLAQAIRPAKRTETTSRAGAGQRRVAWTVGLLGILLAVVFLLIEAILGPGSIASALSLPSLRPTPTFQPTSVAEAIRLVGESDELGFVGRPHSVAVQSEIVYIGERGRLVIVDASSPDRPIVMGELALPTERDDPVTDIFVVGERAYLATWAGGVQIVDISDPDQPELVGGWSPEWFGDGQHPFTFEMVQEVLSVRSGYAYLLTFECQEPCQETAHRPRLRAIDVSDPQSPEAVSSYLGQSYNSVAVMAGALAFMSEPIEAQGRIAIIDFTHPAAPERIGEIQLDEDPGSMAITRGTLYVASQSGVSVIDVSRPTDPVTLGSMPRPAGWLAPQIAVSGDYAYLHESGLEGGRSIERLAVIDLTDRSAPRLVATRTDPAATQPGWPMPNVSASNQVIYRVGRKNTLQIMTFTPPQVAEKVEPQVFGTVVDAAAAAGFEPLIPSRIPSGYSFEYGSYDARTRRLELTYVPRDGTRERLSIAQRLADEPGYALGRLYYPERHIELLEVGGIPAEFINGAFVGMGLSGERPFDPTISNQQLVWVVGGVEIWISANVGREAVMQVAESMH